MLTVRITMFGVPAQCDTGEVETCRVALYEGDAVRNTGRAFENLRDARLYADGMYCALRTAGVASMLVDEGDDEDALFKAMGDAVEKRLIGRRFTATSVAVALEAEGYTEQQIDAYLADALD